MRKIVVTSGSKYTDIDILACAIAYTELLRSEGKDAEAIISPVLNKSITEEIKNWELEYNTRFTEADAFVIVDTSHPKFFSDFVVENKIVELFDHHTGYEKYFHELLGDDSHIEHIGACATLIWEEFKARSPKQISRSSARLLYAAIVSNTLNFNAQITSKRDETATQELRQLTQLPKNWNKKYFLDQDEIVINDPVKETINDTHLQEIEGLDEDVVIGQLELWNSKKFLDGHIDGVEIALKSFNKKHWFLTSPSISEGKNYIYTKSNKIKELLIKKISAKFEQDIGETEKLWLRKEIVRELNNN